MEGMTTAKLPICLAAVQGFDPTSALQGLVAKNASPDLPTGRAASAKVRTWFLSNAASKRDFSQQPPVARALGVVVGAVVLGAIAGLLLGVSAPGYWVVQVIATIGGFLGGTEHIGWRPGLVRGLVAGVLYGATILLVRAITGWTDEVDLGSDTGPAGRHHRPLRSAARRRRRRGQGAPRMSNLADALFQHAAEDPARVAVRAGEASVSYGELRDLVASYAERATAAGVRPGDRVLLVAPTVPEFVVAYYGLHAAGAVLITMNVMATAPEIGYVLDDAEVSLVVAWHESATAASAAADERGVPVWTLGPLSTLPAGGGVDAPVDRADDETAIIIYTSGTTGRPKGAELGVGGIFALVEAARERLAFDPATDRAGTALPLFHVYGQLIVLHISISLGAPVSLLHPFDPRRMLAMIRDHRLTIVSGVPAMWIAMLNAADGLDELPDDLGHLRLASSGGASLPAEVIRAFRERFGVQIREGYGLSETSGWATSTPHDQQPKVGSVGRAVPGMQLEVRDPSGHPVPTGEVGEVWVQGPIVMKGYWNRPEATAETIRDGWLRTGDLGTLDEDGDLRIVDRIKELIIRGGYNVYPREVEEVLYEHPDIVEAAVLGVPDPTYGEEVAAVVVLRPGSELDAETLRTWAKERLSAYKVPHLVQFVPALPKGPSGKILKRAIDREQLRA